MTVRSPREAPLSRSRLTAMADEMTVERFTGLLDSVIRDLLVRGFADAGADEGTAWIMAPDGKDLCPAFNSGPHAKEMVGRFHQPINAGLIGMVFATEQPFVENDVQANANQSRLLDMTLGVKTTALIAVPLHYLGACRGVLSCVQLEGNGQVAHDGFSPAALAHVERTAALLTRLIEHAIITRAGGLGNTRTISL